MKNYRIDHDILVRDEKIIKREIVGNLEKERLLPNKDIYMKKDNDSLLLKPLGEHKVDKQIKKEEDIKDPKQLIKNNLRHDINHHQHLIDDKVHFLIDIYTDKKELLKLKSILIEFENNCLLLPDRKEIEDDEQRKLKKRR